VNSPYLLLTAAIPNASLSGFSYLFFSGIVIFLIQLSWRSWCKRSWPLS